MIAYQGALGVALLVIGAGLVCVALIRGHQAETEPAEPADVDDGELRTFVDSLPPIDEDVDVRPRIDRLRR
jgi:hypothetical protein